MSHEMERFLFNNHYLPSDIFPDMMVNIIFIGVILFFIPVLIYSFNVSKNNKINNIDNKKTRNAYRLKWMAIPEIIVSIFILILRFLIPQMNGLLVSLVIMPTSQLFPIFSSLISIYIKYGKKGLLEPKFFK